MSTVPLLIQRALMSDESFAQMFADMAEKIGVMSSQVSALDERSRSIKEKVDTIETQVKLTNGRVNALEERRANLDGAWRLVAIVGGIVGGSVACFYALLGILAALHIIS